MEDLRKFDGKNKSIGNDRNSRTRMGEMEAMTDPSKKLMNKIIHL